MQEGNLILSASVTRSLALFLFLCFALSLVQLSSQVIKQTTKNIKKGPMMPACLSKTLVSPLSLKMQDDRPSSDQAILCSSPPPTPAAAATTTNNNNKVNHSSSSSATALRRTFSANILPSSDTTTTSTGTLPMEIMMMKKTASSDNLQLGDNEQHHRPPGVGGRSSAFDEIWRSIQGVRSGDNSSSALFPPYVHPLAKKSSARSLSEKSLQICTESLGSETGSDGFSSSASSPTVLEDKRMTNNNANKVELEEEKEEKKNNIQLKYSAKKEESKDDDQEEMEKVKKMVTAKFNKKATGTGAGGARRRNFPPPLPSLQANGGSNLHIRSSRQDGRLVVEAVSVPSTQNCFRAERHNGRLLLTISDDDGGEEGENGSDQEEVDELEYGFDQKINTTIEEEQEKEEQEEVNAEADGGEEQDLMIVMDQEKEAAKLKPTSGEGSQVMVMSCYMHKFFGLTRTNCSHHRLNKAVATATPTATLKEIAGDSDRDLDCDEAAVIKPPPLMTSRSLPPLPRKRHDTTTTSSTADGGGSSVINAYEYYWRSTIQPASWEAPPPLETAVKGISFVNNISGAVDGSTRSSRTRRRKSTDDQVEIRRGVVVSRQALMGRATRRVKRGICRESDDDQHYPSLPHFTDCNSIKQRNNNHHQHNHHHLHHPTSTATTPTSIAATTTAAEGYRRSSSLLFSKAYCIAT